ncbi:hypothetical protein [Halobacterium sp. CBA1126]|uniref:hypothetical protein n=1 Tax=Halobacterium TaxID=2239 RepID=UPI0012FB2793|nr:hypothetical protein [Halobacterium sp. CBA1126]MUV60196.1 hypothetical protein [Halobacterium sp. CBA1126]
MTDADAARDPEELPAEIRESVPTWDDEYFDRVSDRLMFSYDLERDRAVRGERFDLYGELRMLTQKQFFHPALSYADHEAEEYLFARRTDRPTVADLEALVELGHDLADDWITADEEHYETKFTFVLVAEAVPEDVASYVEGFRDRTLLKYGYYGHYEVNLVVVAPGDERAVASEQADVANAFALWGDLEPEPEGFLSRFAKRFWT